MQVMSRARNNEWPNRILHYSQERVTELEVERLRGDTNLLFEVMMEDQGLKDVPEEFIIKETEWDSERGEWTLRILWYTFKRNKQLWSKE